MIFLQNIILGISICFMLSYIIVFLYAFTSWDWGVFTEKEFILTIVRASIVFGTLLGVSLYFTPALTDLKQLLKC